MLALVENVMSIADEINTHGRELLLAIGDVFERPEIRVIAIGDSEGFENATRSLGAQIVNTLAKRGLTHFALEAGATTATNLNECMVAGDPRLHRDRLIQTRWYGAGPDDQEDRPDSAFFGVLFAVYENSIEFIGIDETPSGQYNNRDLYMAERIVEILKDQNAKVLLWGGFMHHYTRDAPTKFKTTVEYLRHRLGKKAVYAVYSWERGSDSQCFVELNRCPLISATKAYPSTIARCGGGPCPGPSCSNHSPPTEERHMPIFALWDAVLIL